MEVLDTEPTVEEISRAIDALVCSKASGEDNIPPGIIKYGKHAVLEPLHQFLCLFWGEEKVPKNLRSAKIITLYKNKSDRSDYYSYPTRVSWEMFCTGRLIHRLQVLADRIYAESQCGFRAIEIHY
ncbi:Uncharacterised protein r2_g4168 [Pycnogonum litorale]